MATPIIQTTQVGPGAGTAGEGREDLLANVVVNFSDTEAANSGGTYLWSIAGRTPGLGGSLTGSGTATPSFTFDGPGSIGLRCQVTLADGTVWAATEVFAVVTTFLQKRIPAFGEGTEYDADGNAYGWALAETEFKLAVDDALADAGVKVSSNDTTSGVLNGKLVAGSGITLTENNNGANETLSIIATNDAKARVSANDTTPGVLNGKLVAGTGITLTENNDGGNETLTVATTVTDTDVKTKVSSNDTTAGFLNGKLVAGANVTLTENNDGSNETLTVAMPAFSGADTGAVHKATAAEISALTAKTTPTKSDKYLGENAANSHSKVYTTLEDFVASAGGPWVRPDSPSAYDDEFDADTSANWTFSPSAVATAIAPYSTIVTNPRVDWGVARRSHLSLQPPDATNAHMARAISLATDCWVHARFNWTHSYVTLSTTVMQWFGLVLSEQGDLAGHYLEMSSGALFAASAKTLRSRAKDAGGTAEIQNIAFSPGAGIPYNHVAIQKISSTYYFYGANDRGEIRYCGSKVWAGNTLDTLVLYFFDDGGAVGSSICFVDFVRYGSGQKWPLL